MHINVTDMNIGIKKVVSFIVLLSFIFSQALYCQESKRSTPAFDELKQEYSRLINEYVNLNKQDIQYAVPNYLFALSLYIKELTNKKDVQEMVANERLTEQDARDAFLMWSRLVALQWKLAEYMSMVKTSVSFEQELSLLAASSVVKYGKYLDTLFVKSGNVANDPAVCDDRSENGNTIFLYKDMDPTNYLSVLNENGDASITGVGFSYDYIRSKDNWGSVDEIIQNYREQKKNPSFNIDLLSEADQYSPLLGNSVKGIVQRASFILEQGTLSQKNIVNNYLVMTQFYGYLYFAALDNAVRIYSDNLYMHDNVPLEQLQKNIIDNFDDKTANYAKFRTFNKIKQAVLDQTEKIKADQTTIFKKQTMEQLAEEVNKKLIPAIRVARQNLAQRTLGHKRLNSNDVQEECISVDEEYYKEIQEIVNTHKVARFLYANKDLRNEFFSNPVYAHKDTGRNSMVIDKLCRNYVKDIRTSLTVSEMRESFLDAQKKLMEYIVELYNGYKKSVDSFLLQEGLPNLETFQVVTIQKTEDLLELSYDITKTSPLSSAEVFKKYSDLSLAISPLINDYIKSLKQSEERHQKLNQYFAVVGIVLGVALTISIIGSETGIPIIGANAVALSATKTGLDAAFTAYMGYQAVDAYKEYGKIKEKKKTEIVKSQVSGVIDPKLMVDLTAQQKESLISSIVNGVFAFLGTAGVLVELKIFLGLRSEQEVVKAFADVSTWMEQNKVMFGAQELEGLHVILGDESYGKLIVYLHRYLTNTKLVAQWDLKQDFSLFINHINYIKIELQEMPIVKIKSSAGTVDSPKALSSYAEFKDWFTKIRFNLRVNRGSFFYKLATEGHLGTIKEGGFLHEDVSSCLFPPEMMAYLDLPINKVYKDNVCYELSFKHDISLIESESYLRSLTSPDKLPGYNIKSLITRKNPFVVVNEEVTEDILSRFPKFCLCSNWTNKIALTVKDEKELGQFVEIVKRTKGGHGHSEEYFEMVPKRCVAKGEGGIECVTDTDILDKKIQILRHLNTHSDYSIKVLSKVSKNGVNGFASYLGPRYDMLDAYPNTVTLVTRNFENTTLLHKEIQARGYDILKRSKIVYNTDMRGVDMEKALEVYLTVIEPNQQAVDCFNAYIAMMDWLRTTNGDQGIGGLSVKGNYSNIFRKMIWPETNGISPVQGSEAIKEFFQKTK